jgi:DNA-binding NtrC family response regulator
MERPRVLVASCDAAFRQVVRLIAKAKEWDTVECDVVEVRVTLEHLQPAAVVLGSPDVKGSWLDIATAKEIRRNDRHTPLLLLAKEITSELVLAALRAGLSDLRVYPGTPGELVQALSELLNSARAPKPSQDSEVDRIVGGSRATQELRSYLDKVAGTDCNVLITGETGTGKELAAERIHLMSPRRHKPLVPVNCAAIPEALVESELFGYERGAFTGAHASREGKFKIADGGTVFLDEIGDMDMGSQAKLLRVIESKQVHSLGGRSGVPLDVRVVAATNQDPEQLVRQNRFRKDLYFRLNVARVQLKPLRERREDIGPLIEHTIQSLNRRFDRDVEGCDDQAISLLTRYDWPGNVRELKNLLEATFIALGGRVIAPSDFPEAFRQRLEPLLEAPATERERLLAALCATKWNKSKAAEALRWSRMTLYRKIAKYQIETQPEEV